jgi:heme exporter protein C
LGYICLACMVATWGYGLWFAPTEVFQGEIYRILYLHVPCALSTFLAAFWLFLASLHVLIKKTPQKSIWMARAAAEVGFLYTLLTLFTGSVWGYPTWGVWWTWDARLTTTLILAFLYGCYLLLWSSLESHSLRCKVCSVLGILIFLDVPVIYKSVTWWRTLHQPPSLLSADAPMSAGILYPLIASILAMVGVSLWLIRLRSQTLQLENEVEEALYRSAHQRISL